MTKTACWLALMTVVAGSNSVQSTRGPSVLLSANTTFRCIATKQNNSRINEKQATDDETGVQGRQALRDTSACRTYIRSFL